MGHVTITPFVVTEETTSKNTGIREELERHLTEFITCQRHIGVLHTKEQVRVHNNICHLSTQAYGFLGFSLYSERAFDFVFRFFSYSEFSVFQDTSAKPRQPQARSHTHSISSARCDWVRGGCLDCIFGRGRICRNIGWPLLFFFLWFGCLSYFFYFLFFIFFFFLPSLSLLRLTIRGTCSNALKPGKKGPGQKLWIPNSSFLDFSGGIKGSFQMIPPYAMWCAFTPLQPHNPLDLVFPFSCTISRPWMTDITTT
jgi:hypothetical protein